MEKHEGIFYAIDSVDAERASSRPSPRAASLAAHANHLLYALRIGNSYLGRERPQGCWDDTWVQNVYQPEEWRQLKDDIREEYEYFLNGIKASPDWNKEDVNTAFQCQIAHTAYHLGAMRFMFNLV